jgi:hypothetical protein
VAGESPGGKRAAGPILCRTEPEVVMGAFIVGWPWGYVYLGFVALIVVWARAKYSHLAWFELVFPALFVAAFPTLVL